MRGFSGGLGRTHGFQRPAVGQSTGPNRRYFYKDTLDGNNGDWLWQTASSTGLRSPNYGTTPAFNNVNFDNSVRFFNGGSGNNQGGDVYRLDGRGGAQADLSFINFQAPSRFHMPAINVLGPAPSADVALEFEIEQHLSAPYPFSLLLAARCSIAGGGAWSQSRKFIGAQFDQAVNGELTVKAVHCSAADGYAVDGTATDFTSYVGTATPTMKFRLVVAGQERQIFVNGVLMYRDTFSGFTAIDDGVWFAPIFEGTGAGLTTSRMLSLSAETLLIDFAEDTASISEALAHGVVTLDPETGTFTDATVNSKYYAVVEHGTFSESVSANTGFVNNVAEHGTFDEAFVSVIPTTATEHGTFSEANSLAVASNATVTGTFSDAVSSIGTTLANNATNTGTFTDALSCGPVTLVPEHGTFSEETSLTTTFGNNAAEHGTFSESTSTRAIATTVIGETGTFSEATAGTLVGVSLALEYGFFSDATQGQGKPVAWVAHLETFAMTRYSNFGFSSLAAVDGVLLGTGVDGGVYRVDAAKDAGVNIDASIAFDWSDRVPGGRQGMVPDPHFKLPRQLSASGTCDGQMAFDLGYTAAGAEASASYELPLRSQSGFVSNRVLLGRGIRSRYLQPTIRNVDGADFTLPEAHIDVELSKRMI